MTFKYCRVKIASVLLFSVVIKNTNMYDSSVLKNAICFLQKTFRKSFATAPFTWMMVFNLKRGRFIARHRLFNVKCAKYFSLVNVIS